MMEILLLIFLILLPFTLLFFAAMFSAVMDVVKHKFAYSIYFRPGEKKKIFGFEWNWWWQSLGKNKYHTDEDGNILLDENGKYLRRMTKVLFWYFNLVQIYDAWHYYKMWKIGFNILADIAASALAVYIFILFNPALWLWFALALIYFILQAAVWNVTFNYYYDFKLIKPEHRGKK
jgi:hypothetical protein